MILQTSRQLWRWTCRRRIVGILKLRKAEECFIARPNLVMAGLDPAISLSALLEEITGSSPVMTPFHTAPLST
jgi:hypothetical protein